MRGAGRRPGAAPARRRRWLAALVVLALAALAGCGVSTDGSPRAIADDDVPFGLLAQPSTTTTVPDTNATVRTVTVYLLDEKGALRPVDRVVELPVTAFRVATALLLPPTAEETRAGLSTALTADTELRGLDGPIGGLLTVDLSSSLLNVTGRRQIQALAQVVFTMTDVPNVQRVLFEFDGRRRDVPRGDGDLASTPLSRSDYAALEPPSSTTTTGPPTPTTAPAG
jgi:hypothetical protein